MPTQTLQRHLSPFGQAEAASAPRTLYVLDESSLASTVQMHAFLNGLQLHDRVLLVGDTRQHQSVDAGRSYEQLQEAGLRTASLDDIVRQRTEPAYKAVVEQLSRGETREAIAALDKQGRVHEVPGRDDRLRAIAAAFSAHPAGTIVVSPDNQSRAELNDAIHQTLTAQGAVRAKAHCTTVLIPRQDMTGADRALAHRYHEGDVIRYTNGSKALGLVSGDRAKVESVNDATNELTVRHVTTGVRITYDPRELHGVSLFRDADRAFAIGDRVQFTAPFREQRVGNRELGTITALPAGTMKVKLDSGRSVGFHLKDYPHVDYGYAVTSHSSQGQTADRVIVHIDTDRAGEALVQSPACLRRAVPRTVRCPDLHKRQDATDECARP